jgi:hypothetical protein
MKQLFRIGCVALAFFGCAAFVDDAVWMQQKTVAIGSANFQQCVATAVASVPGVAVNRAVPASTAKVVLEVKLARPIPFLDAEVQRRGDKSAAVVFSGKGATEPANDRKQIDPLLNSLADAVAAKCGSGAK